MTYTAWMHGQKIGETKFELWPVPWKRAGTFHPTEFGLTVLPQITAMLPALLAFGALCRREGLDVTNDDPEAGKAALDAFGGTPEGKRVIASARQIVNVELRDPLGRTLLWESLAISDTSELLDLARRYRKDPVLPHAMTGGDPCKFMISVTLAQRLRSVSHTGLLVGQSATVC